MGQKGNAIGNIANMRSDYIVHRAACLTGVAGDFGGAFLVVIQLLQRHDGHVDVVLLEAVQTDGIVHQHVGVEDEQLGVHLCFRVALGGHISRMVLGISPFGKAGNACCPRGRTRR